MKVSLLQMQIKLGDFTSNQATIHRLIEKSMENKPDIIALPEMWNVGFFPRPLNEYTDPSGEKCQSFLSNLAKQYNVNIVGGSIARITDKQLYNTNYTFDRSGNLVASYDKIHLFSPAKEDKLFTAGNKYVVFELDGIRSVSYTHLALLIAQPIPIDNKVSTNSYFNCLFITVSSSKFHWRLCITSE